MIIDSPQAASAFAAALPDQPRLGRNAIGASLLEGKRRIEANDIRSLRQVIDFPGDSAASFTGPAIVIAREDVLAAGITINDLPILCDECFSSQGGDLVKDYRTRIIGSPGAFLVAAETRDQFAEAVRRKLVPEIAGRIPSDQTAALHADHPVHP